MPLWHNVWKGTTLLFPFMLSLWKPVTDIQVSLLLSVLLLCCRCLYARHQLASSCETQCS
jgi:hypothetical protein